MRSVHVRTRRRRARGFTLPELMAVVAIVGVMAAIAMATMSRSGDAQNSASLARAIEFSVATARANAISDGFQRRLTCTPNGDLSTCVVEKACQAGMVLPTTCVWTNDAKLSANSHATLWNITLTEDDAADNSGGSQSTTARTMYLRPDGSVCDTTATDAAPSAACTSAGFTYYVSDVKASNKSNHYKVYVYGITGMPRLVNAW